MAKEKSRFFTFLMYPSGEGFPSDWKDRLEKIGLPIAVSPLHDKDKSKTEPSGFKKAHYHGIYIARNPVTADSVRLRLKAVLSSEKEECKAIAKVQIIRESVESTYLYLTHESKDAIKKGKHKYDKKDITHINNFDLDRYITLDVEQKKDIFNILTMAISTKYICNVIDLNLFVQNEGDSYGLKWSDVQEVLKANSGILRLYFDGAYAKSKKWNIQTYDEYLHELELKAKEVDDMEMEFTEEEKAEFGIKEN